MLTIQDYILPRSLEEAYEVIKVNKNNTILGGCAFLKMGSKKIGKAVDLSNLHLNYIEENEDTIEIGAMTTFREIETSPILAEYFNGILPKSVENIVGIQLRNIVTVGATVYSRYGFSDFITALLSLDAEVVLYNAGRNSLEDFLKNGVERDILVKIVLKKNNRKAAFQMMRNSKSDYAILNVAVSKLDNNWKIVIGARPQRAEIAKKASMYLAESEGTIEDIQQASIIAAGELIFGSNMRGSKEYRQSICRALVKRAIMEVLA